VRCVPRARSEKCKRGGCETKGRDLIMRSLRRDTMPHRTMMQARDAREIDSEPYVTLGSIKVLRSVPGLCCRTSDVGEIQSRARELI